MVWRVRCLCAVGISVLIAQDKLALAADPPAASQVAHRSVQAIAMDIQKASAALGEFDPADLLDPVKRKEISTRVLPSLRTVAALADELTASDDADAREHGQMMKTQLTSMRIILGDKELTDQLDKQTYSSNAAEALVAKSDLLPARWLLANKDDAAQAKMLAEASELAKSNPTDNRLTVALATMTQMGASSAELTKKVEDVIIGMKSEVAGQMAPVIEARRKFLSMENHPLVIKGTRLGGGEFSTETWKGKVILVDFWATWCAPCLEELPRVKKAYSSWHDKGLEIVGVSCDSSSDELKRFLASNSDMPWPQLYDPKTTRLHPIATGFGIPTIPAMFLIDRKGVVRAVEAQGSYEELIPKLLEEK